MMWLNDKEEEEVNFDWSDRNANMTAKKDNYSVRFTANPAFTYQLLHLVSNNDIKSNQYFVFPTKIAINSLILIIQGLMRELELREKKVSDLQVMGDRLVRDGHPGKKTVEVITLNSQSPHAV